MRATLEFAPDKRPWNKAQAVFPCGMCESAALPRETFDIKWVSTGIRISVNSTPSGALPVSSQLASITTGATWVLNRESSTVLLPVLMSVCCKPFWMMRDARRHVLQPRSSLDRGFFARLLSIVKMVTAAVSGRTTCDSNIIFCTTSFCFYALQESVTTSAMNVLGSNVYGRDHVNHFPVPGLTMRHAPPSWWHPRWPR